MKGYWERIRENRPEPELILLPPKERFECFDCKRKFTKLQKCKDGKKRCKMCKKKLITNKFYIPLKERRNLNGTLGKFSLTNQEKTELHRQFMNGGLDSTQAWQKVYFHIRMLKNEKRRKRYSDKERRRYFAMKNRKRKEQKEKFIGGLE